MPTDASTILIAWILFAGASGLTIFLGIVLMYHWYRYAMNIGVATLASMIYIAGSALTLGLIATTIFALS